MTLVAVREPTRTSGLTVFPILPVTGMNRNCPYSMYMTMVANGTNCAPSCNANHTGPAKKSTKTVRLGNEHEEMKERGLRRWLRQ